jgi:hypothetical protein
MKMGTARVSRYGLCRIAPMPQIPVITEIFSNYGHRMLRRTLTDSESRARDRESAIPDAGTAAQCAAVSVG